MEAAPHTKLLASQVGGHPGVTTTEDGSLLIKPSFPAEVAFYQALAADPRLADLRDFVPEFYGTLKLEGRVENESGRLDMNAIKPVQGVPENEKDEYAIHSQSIVLENLAYTFLKPNILDIKLGTVLADEDATPEKRARMEKVAAETTSGETGMRLTGFQVYDLAADKPIVTTKAYGKSIKAAELPEGIARFFPLATSPTSALTSSTQPTTSAGTAHASGLPPQILLPILTGITSDIKEIFDTMKDIELRMVGGSLLIIYEADWNRAREGLQLLREAVQRAEAGTERGEGEGEDDDEDDDDEDDDDDDDDDESAKGIGLPFTVKLIDFAHTKLVPGRGPDEGVLRGLRMVLGLLKGRAAEVKAASVNAPTST